MKKLIVTLAIALAVLVAFTGGVFASSNWVVFEGEEDVEQTSNDIDEIMTILEQLNADKISAEEALAQLEEEYDGQAYEDLIDKIDELHGVIDERDTMLDERNATIDRLNAEIDRLQAELDSADGDSEYIDHLEEELQKANEQVKALKEGTGNAVEKAREYVE